MKYLLTAAAFSFCLTGIAATEITTQKPASFSIESTIQFDTGKKKNRRVKRVKAKRKRRCHRSARRNFAG